MYKGEYLNGYKDGNGLYTWPDGTYYDGSWVKNSINGQGLYHWNDGR